MDSVQIVLLIVVFIAMALSMFFRKITALIALPLMAFLVALFGAIQFTDIFQCVIGQGSLKLYNAYTIAVFGSMLKQNKLVREVNYIELRELISHNLGK